VSPRQKRVFTLFTLFRGTTKPSTLDAQQPQAARGPSCMHWLNPKPPIPKTLNAVKKIQAAWAGPAVRALAEP
jgi:hypothetical protein